MTTAHTKRGMTLIELLAVILIMGILAAILMPVLQKARMRGRLIKAQSEVRELNKAWGAYLVTYVNDPGATVPAGVFSMNPAMVALLQHNNPNNIKFMEFPPSAAASGFRDPWNNLYKVQIPDPDDVVNTVSYATRVHCMNRKRGGS